MMLSKAELEKIIAQSVRATHSDCETFIAAFIEYNSDPDGSRPNWHLKGCKFGAASRSSCEISLAEIVPFLQKRFSLTEEATIHEAMLAGSKDGGWRAFASSLTSRAQPLINQPNQTIVST